MTGAGALSGLPRTRISSVSGIRVGRPLLNLPFHRRSHCSFGLPNRYARWSSQHSQSCAYAISSAERHCSGHEISQAQSRLVDSVSGGIQPLSNDHDSCGGTRECLSSSMQRIELGRADEILALGLVAGALLIPEQSWAADMDTVTTASTAQGFMAWAANEPANALSLPTWTIHVASVAEWVTAMALVWKYGDTPGKSTWKGLTWGMVPLLGGAMCACTWHFFYNAPSLEVLVVLQAFLTVVGNCTMWIAAYRIWKASQEEASV